MIKRSLVLALPVVISSMAFANDSGIDTSEAAQKARSDSLGVLKACAQQQVANNPTFSFDEVAHACSAELDRVFFSYAGLSKEYVLSELQDDFMALKH